MSNDVHQAASDQNEELERLRAENESLRAEATAKKEHHGLRRWTSVTIAVILAVLIPIAAVTVWTQRTALDTDQYVDTVGPLASDEAIQNRVTEVVSEQINAEVDFEQTFQDAIDEAGLPEQLSTLVGPLAGGAESIVQRVVGEIVASDAFATVWEEANRAGHELVVAVLTGQGGDNYETDSGTIRITFDSLAERVSETLTGILGEDLVAQLPLDEIDPEIVLLESEDLASAQSAVDLLDTLSWFVPLVTLGLLALVVIVAHDRRRGFRRVGLAMLLSSLIALVLLAVARGRVVDQAVDEEAADALTEQLLSFLVQELRVLAVLGAVILAGAWLVGPSASSARLRAWGNTLLGRVSTVEEPAKVGAFPVWVVRSRTGLLVGALLIGGLVLIVWDRPTVWTVLVLAILTGAVMLAIEALARVGRQAVSLEPASAPEPVVDHDDAPPSPEPVAGQDDAPPSPEPVADQDDAPPSAEPAPSAS